MSVHHPAQLVIELSIKCGAIIPGQTGVFFSLYSVHHGQRSESFFMGGLLRFLLAERWMHMLSPVRSINTPHRSPTLNTRHGIGVRGRSSRHVTRTLCRPKYDSNCVDGSFGG